MYRGLKATLQREVDRYVDQGSKIKKRISRIVIAKRDESVLFEEVLCSRQLKMNLNVSSNIK